MRVAICTLRAAAEDIERHSTRRELCDGMRRFNALLRPLLEEYCIPRKQVTPSPLRDTYDPSLKFRLVMQANKACLARPDHVREELSDVYDIFAELQEQYCVSTRELERVA